MADREHTGRTVALVGGTALAAWWFLSRGKGWGFRSPGDGIGAHANGTRAPAKCKVWIYPEGTAVDGVITDLSTVVEKCRAAGAAEVGATGDSITRVIHEVLQALKAAGIKLQVRPDLSYLARMDRL